MLGLFYFISYPHAFLRDYNFMYLYMTSWNFQSFFSAGHPRPGSMMLRYCIPPVPHKHNNAFNNKLIDHSMAKYVFVTGGVTSSLGKGIIAASLAKLLQARGLWVTIQ